MYNRHIANMNLHEIIFPSSSPQLAHRLNERHALDISHRPAQFDYTHVRLLACIVHWYARHLLDPVLYRIGDVRHDLHGFAEIVAFALALDDMLVDLAGCDVVVAREGDVEVALVVAEIKVDFAAVGKDKDFAVPSLHVGKIGRYMWG
jgi:hypothetical protein